MRTLLLALVVFCAPALVGCQPPCGPSTCAGCCDADGACVEAPDNVSNSLCGGAGLACATCGNHQICDPSRLVCIANIDATTCTNPPVQTASEPCCIEYGADACGAGLFCAAYDVRTRTSCYREYSRLNQQECTGDRQCASGSCNTSARKCRGMYGELCTMEIGCAPSGPLGAALSCSPYDGRYICDS